MARIGLVLGAGGSTGGAFHAGVLAAIEESIGWDPRTADLVVGTSAGSVTAATLRAGLSAADIAARQLGQPLSATGRALLGAAGLRPDPPPTPVPASGRSGPSGGSRYRPSAPLSVFTAARRPWATRPLAVMAGLMPEGSVSTTVISDAVGALLGDTWPTAPMWITAVDLDRARLVVFGREGSVPARPADAVAASCAIPAWFTPVRIGGARYVDGGTYSLTNLSLVSTAKLDMVVVIAPMGRAGRSTSPAPVRQYARSQLAVDVQILRRRGVEVVAFQPTAEDQAIMGPNAMDAGRRAPVTRQVRESTLARMQKPEFRRRLDHLTSG